MIGRRITTKGHTIHTAYAPIRSPWRAHTDCGMISPKMTMTIVEISPPTTPDVISAEKIAISELTSVLPTSSVHSSVLPRLRSG